MCKCQYHHPPPAGRWHKPAASEPESWPDTQAGPAMSGQTLLSVKKYQLVSTSIKLAVSSKYQKVAFSIDFSRKMAFSLSLSRIRAHNKFSKARGTCSESLPCIKPQAPTCNESLSRPMFGQDKIFPHHSQEATYSIQIALMEW